jgi:aminoglycoside phosphotransferase family enzyme
MLLSGGLKDLFELFFDNYLDKTGDEELLEVIPPFFAFRAVVVASPTWYPRLSHNVRRAVFNFLGNVLRENRFDYRNIAKYFS